MWAQSLRRADVLELDENQAVVNEMRNAALRVRHADNEHITFFDPIEGEGSCNSQ